MNAPDYALYFANSSFGGGYVRLWHSVRSISEPNFWFFVNRAVARKFPQGDSRIVPLEVSKLQRLWDENRALEPFDLSRSVVFAHGAPITPRCKALILHISNALPLVYRTVTTTWALKAKMSILQKRLRYTAERAECVTVESESTRLLIAAAWGDRVAAKCRILTCGVDPCVGDVPQHALPEAPFALAIGTYPYKRVPEVIRVFRTLQRQNPLMKLVIVGMGEVKANQNYSTIQYRGGMPFAQARALTANCDAYITMSEIENCSIALLEAIYHRRKIYCSAIPSHTEFLNKHGYQTKPYDAGILLGLPSAAEDAATPIPTWLDIGLETTRLLSEFS